MQPFLAGGGAGKKGWGLMRMLRGRLDAALLVGCSVLIFGGALTLAPPPAVAQFVCVGNTTGGDPTLTPSSGAGANAAGGGTACGPNANALGGLNAAFGQNANASSPGANSNNAAVGLDANSSGSGSLNRSYRQILVTAGAGQAAAVVG